MRTLNLYLLREISLPFVVGLGLFFVVVTFAQVLKVSDAVTGLGISGGDVVRALGYSLPPLLGLLIPVSLLFATLLGIGRVSSDRELVGMAAAGVSPFRLLYVPSALGLMLAGICGYALAVGEPWGIRGLRHLMATSAQRALASGVRVGEFTEWVPGVTFMARAQVGRELADVVFADRRDPARPMVISAKRGKVGAGLEPRDIVFELEDGAIVLHDREVVRVLRFEKSLYRLDVQGMVGNKLRTASALQEKSLFELWEESQDPQLNHDGRAFRTITLHRKLALPVATLLFALLAVPLAARPQGGARARGFLYSAALVGAYYYLGRGFELAARGGAFDPVLAAWMPNLIGLLALAILLKRLPRSAM
ncbi:MAG: LptF/LptG family permease [Deltaproteobacteria bacterium]|nr:LptF/LptG family permease [Deltaproteobacteria bacterium]